MKSGIGADEPAAWGTVVGAGVLGSSPAASGPWDWGSPSLPTGSSPVLGSSSLLSGSSLSLSGSSSLLSSLLSSSLSAGSPVAVGAAEALVDEAASELEAAAPELDGAAPELVGAASRLVELETGVEMGVDTAAAAALEKSSKDTDEGAAGAEVEEGAT